MLPLPNLLPLGLLLLLLALTSSASAAPSFAVSDDSFTTAGTTVRIKVLKNTATGEEASVNVNYGGGVESLSLRSPGQSTPRSVLWTHDKNATAVALNVDWRGRMLIPYGVSPQETCRCLWWCLGIY